jgi:hypothetical protein
VRVRTLMLALTCAGGGTGLAAGWRCMAGLQYVAQNMLHALAIGVASTLTLLCCWRRERVQMVGLQHAVGKGIQRIARVGTGACATGQLARLSDGLSSSEDFLEAVRMKLICHFES